jgi:hypothetical protein
MYSGFSKGYKNPMRNLGSGASNVAASSSGMMAKFRNNKIVGGTSDFLYSNSLVAKVCFLVLIVILFIFAARLGSRFLNWIVTPARNPILIDGMKDAKKLSIIHQNPSVGGSKPVLRSVNERHGLEFTWSVWLYIDDVSPTYSTNACQKNCDTKQASMSGRRKHIFHKGSSGKLIDGDKYNDINVSGLAFPNNGPGLYLHESKNNLIVVMNTFDSVLEEVEIEGIPLHKWINVVLKVKGKKLDTYINGSIVNRHIFESVPKQNYGDVYVNMNNGFSGMLSSLRYFDKALTGVEIENLVKTGPNMTAVGDMNIFPKYLSLRWFFQKPALGN